MWDFDISRTLGIMMKTMPFILLRMAIYFGITLGYMLAIGAGSGIGYGVGQLGDDPAAFALGGGVAGFAIVSLALYWLREYILYVVKAGHIAVMVELIGNRPIPDNKGQIAHAREVVTGRFGETSALFALDQLIKGAIAAITGLLGGVAAFLPIPGLQGIAKLINGVIRMSLTFVDEIVLGYNIRTGSTNPWESSRQGVVLYAQNAKIMVKNAVWLTLIMWALSFVIFLLLLAPAGALVWAMPGAASGWGFVVALVFAWALKAALLEPFAIAALMSVYFKAIEGQRPDPVWDGKLKTASGKFRELADKAAAFAPARSYQPTDDTGPATAV